MSDIKTDNLWLMKGDCLERMKEIHDGSVDMILTDPPYGTTACKWDSVIPLEPMWGQLKRIIKPNGAIVMTASQPFTTTLIASNTEMFRQIQVWDKKIPTGHLNAKKKILSRHEDIVMFSSAKFGRFTYNPQMTKGRYRNKTPKRKADEYTDRVYSRVTHKGDSFNDSYYPTSIVEVSNANQRNKQHPTQKPVALMEYLIKTYTNEGEMVLDFTMGSGTTGVACNNINRKFIGIEMDEQYFEIAKQRILESQQ
jgi:site-specific DNA-methyltransferase (adenine-specific)